MPAISDHDMNATLFEESRQHRNEFNTSASLFELYQYVLQYLPEVSYDSQMEKRVILL